MLTYSGCTGLSQNTVKEIRKELEEKGAADICFTDCHDMRATFQDVYKEFLGYSIVWCDSIKNCDVHVLISNFKVRTSGDKPSYQLEKKRRDELPRKKIDEVDYPRTLDEIEGYGEGPLPDFEPTEDTHVCACCGKRLPISKFTIRVYGEHTYCQAYCKKCRAIYDHWRDHFLHEHDAEHLVDEFTEGRKQRNELFHEWLKSRHDELEGG